MIISSRTCLPPARTCLRKLHAVVDFPLLYQMLRDMTFPNVTVRFSFLTRDICRVILINYSVDSLD